MRGIPSYKRTNRLANVKRDNRLTKREANGNYYLYKYILTEYLDTDSDSDL